MNKIKKVVVTGLAVACLMAPTALSGEQNIHASRISKVSQHTLHQNADYSYKLYRTQVHNFQKIRNITRKQIRHSIHRHMSKRAKRHVKALKNDIIFYNKEIQQKKQIYHRSIWARRQLKLEAKRAHHSTKRTTKYNKHLYNFGRSEAYGIHIMKTDPYNTRSFRAGFINGLQHKKHLSYRSASRLAHHMYRALPGSDMEVRLGFDGSVQQA